MTSYHMCDRKHKMSDIVGACCHINHLFDVLSGLCFSHKFSLAAEPLAISDAI